MKTRIFLIPLLVTAVALSAVMTDVYADGYRGKAGCGCSKSRADLKSKLYKKFSGIFANQEELGISDGQMKKIKSLKVEMKKDIIRKEAAVEIAAIDIKAMLREDKIDTDAIGKLIDKKYDIKKEKAKSLVDTYAKLKDILTKEQQDKLKGLYKKSRGGTCKKCGPGKK
ncbi:Spy/CpxP family protein refolding chaperone [Candidatus Omnitrophota bacterium]